MATNSHQLYTFLTACSGNWRNTIYIHNQERNHADRLLAFDRDGAPVFMNADELQQVSGGQIDPSECCGQLTETGFKDLFAQHLLWQTSSPQDQPIDHRRQ